MNTRSLFIPFIIYLKAGTYSTQEWYFHTPHLLWVFAMVVRSQNLQCMKGLHKFQAKGIFKLYLSLLSLSLSGTTTENILDLAVGQISTTAADTLTILHIGSTTGLSTGSTPV